MESCRLRQLRERGVTCIDDSCVTDQATFHLNRLILPAHLLQEKNTVIEELVNEYLTNAERTAMVDYSDQNSVREFNAASDRMREIADIIIKLGDDAVLLLASLLDREPASFWVAVHLVEMANLDASILSRCFVIVEQSKFDSQASGNLADVTGKEMWLREWREKKGMTEH